MTTTELVTLPIAVLGAVLGIINTWRGLDRDRVKLRVTAKVAYPVGPLTDGRPQLCIEVLNLSAFPVTVREVGFLLAGTDRRAALINPILYDQGSFPRRMEPRSAFTAYFRPGAEADLANITKAYASTDCDERRTSSARNIRRAVKRLVERDGV